MVSPASLTLTPGSLCHGSPELLNPKPDWSLQDLKEELDVLSLKFYRTPTKEHTPSSHLKTASYRFSWRDLSVVADFGRGGRPFRISAFNDDSESEEDDMSEVESRRHNDSDTCGVSQLAVQSTAPVTNAVDRHDKVDSPAAGLSHPVEYDKSPWLLHRSEVSEGLMLELEHERLLRVQEEVRQRRSILESLVEEDRVKAAASIQRVVKEEELRKEMAHRLDQQYLRSIADVRDTHLSALQREHEQRSQVEERKLRKEAEAYKRAMLAREEKERQEKLKAEAEAKKKAEALLAAEALRKKQAEAAAAAASQRAEAERLAKAAAEQSLQDQAAKERASLDISSTTRAASEPKPIVSKAAADLELMRRKKLVSLLELSQSFQMNSALKKVLKDQGRNFTRLLQQLAATQDQVRTKSMNLLNELAPSAHQPFAVTTFASKVMAQCELQVAKLPSYAFALAQVVVNISSRIPEVMDVVLARLNQVCIFTVPKYYVYKESQFDNDKAYLKVCGYKAEEGKLEDDKEYVARMKAYVTLYAAITQAETDGGTNPHGLKEGWAWCARLLNNLPANRLTAAALEAYLEVAGFRLCQVYNKSFMKMMHVIAMEFIQNLKKQNDPDSVSVVNRLETYIVTKQFLREPDGRCMPKTDLSSYRV